MATINCGHCGSHTTMCEICGYCECLSEHVTQVINLLIAKVGLVLIFVVIVTNLKH